MANYNIPPNKGKVPDISKGNFKENKSVGSCTQANIKKSAARPVVGK